MTLRKKHGDYIMTCDQCGDEFLSGMEDWHDALQEAKDEGYAVRQEDGEWVHYCEDCK